MEDLMSGGNGLLERLEGYGRLALGMGTRGCRFTVEPVDWIRFALGASTGVHQETYRVLSAIVVFSLELKSFLVGNGSVLVWPWETLCSEGAKMLPGPVDWHAVGFSYPVCGGIEPPLS